MSNDGTSENPTTPPLSPFEKIKKVTDDGQSEYWSARDFAHILEYNDYRNFLKVVAKARLACVNSGKDITDHFVDVTDMINIGKGAKRKVADVLLSRYACYLTIQNADPDKEIVALGQTYFAIQVTRQEEADRLEGLTENQRRIYLRDQLSHHNRQLADTANRAGVIKAVDFAIFQDHGYIGLYGGLQAKDIHINKNLKKGQEILDYMGSEELAANLFRATQTEAKLRRENIKGKKAANQAHLAMGRKVREFIEDVGGTMPENLPTPQENIKQLEKRQKNIEKRGPQLSMFEEPKEGE